MKKFSEIIKLPNFSYWFYREQPRFNWLKGKKLSYLKWPEERKHWQNDVFLGEGSPRLNSMCQGKITHSHTHMISSALQETGFYLMFGNIISETFLICLQNTQTRKKCDVNLNLDTT